MTRKLVAAIACRNQGSRLYGKPIQNLDVTAGVTILDNIIACLQSVPAVDEIVLGISEGIENEVFTRIAEAKGLRYVVGDEVDVLGRLVSCGQIADATDIFRVTSESPFPLFGHIEEQWAHYQEQDAEVLFFDDVVDGCGFEIISLEALERSHRLGEKKHRSELCTLYIREHHDDFRVLRVQGPEAFNRKDLRLTVDNPEDLALCRTLYGQFKDQAPRIELADIIAFLDANPKLIELTAPFAEAGYQTMYVWGNS